MNEDLEDEVEDIEDDIDFDAEMDLDDDSMFNDLESPLSEMEPEEQNEVLRSVIDRMVNWLAETYSNEEIMTICSNEMGLTEDEILELIHVKQDPEEHMANVTPEERAELQESINRKMQHAAVTKVAKSTKITESMNAEARRYGYRNYKDYLNNH